MTEPHRAPTAELPAAPARTSRIRGARRTAVILIVASLSLTAIIGIITLLSGDFGEIQGKTMLTTLVIALASVTALCHLAVVGRPVRIVGFVGLAASGIALVLGLTAIWITWNTADGDFVRELIRWFGITGIIALSFAHANLLLLLSARRHTVVRVALGATLVAIAIVATMLIVPILTDFDVPGPNDDTYWRVFGVVAIIDALGTIVVPIVALFLRDDEPDVAAAPAPAAPEASDIEARIAALSGDHRPRPRAPARRGARRVRGRQRRRAARRPGAAAPATPAARDDACIGRIEFETDVLLRVRSDPAGRRHGAVARRPGGPDATVLRVRAPHRRRRRRRACRARRSARCTSAVARSPSPATSR